MDCGTHSDFWVHYCSQTQLLEIEIGLFHCFCSDPSIAFWLPSGYFAELCFIINSEALYLDWRLISKCWILFLFLQAFYDLKFLYFIILPHFSVCFESQAFLYIHHLLNFALLNFTRPKRLSSYFTKSLNLADFSVKINVLINVLNLQKSFYFLYK